MKDLPPINLLCLKPAHLFYKEKKIVKGYKEPSKEAIERLRRQLEFIDLWV